MDLEINPVFSLAHEGNCGYQFYPGLYWHTRHFMNALMYRILGLHWALSPDYYINSFLTPEYVYEASFLAVDISWEILNAINNVLPLNVQFPTCFNSAKTLLKLSDLLLYFIEFPSSLIRRKIEGIKEEKKWIFQFINSKETSSIHI